MRVQFLLIVTIMLWGSATAFAAEPPALRYNPFSQPLRWADVRVPGAVTGGAPTSAAMELRATLLAGRDSLANVDGHILRLGEELHGYRLVEVSEGRAVLASDEDRLELDVNTDADGTYGDIEAEEPEEAEDD